MLSYVNPLDLTSSAVNWLESESIEQTNQCMYTNHPISSTRSEKADDGSEKSPESSYLTIEGEKVPHGA